MWGPKAGEEWVEILERIVFKFRSIFAEFSLPEVLDFECDRLFEHLLGRRVSEKEEGVGQNL